MIRFRSSAALLLLAVAACKTPADKSPSLAIRDAERVTGTAQPVQPYVPPVPPPAVLDRLDLLVAEAEAAHADFVSAAPMVRRAVTAARGDGPGTTDWANAQVALSVLEADRGRVTGAVADLDTLYAEAAVAGEALGRIAAARGKVTDMLAIENDTLTTLFETLG